jgi:hypothetical protein
MQNVRPRDPVTLGLCTLKDLNDAVDRARRKAAREDAARKKAARQAGEPEPATDATAETPAEALDVDPAEADQPDVAHDDAGEHRH